MPISIEKKQTMFTSMSKRIIHKEREQNLAKEINNLNEAIEVCKISERESALNNLLVDLKSL